MTRALAILLVLAGVASAERSPRVAKARDMRSAERVEWRALRTGDVRAKALDELVSRRVLNKKTRALVPHADALGRLLKELLGKSSAVTYLTPETCYLASATAVALVIACGTKSCNSCAVIEAEATLRVRAGTSSIHGLLVKQHGDTGECGDCMHVD